MLRKENLPEVDEFVVCTVTSVKKFGAFVSLDEYGNKEGFIHVAEVAAGWVKYIRDHVREGQKIVCKVLGVDAKKNHIDLSLKRVNEHQKRDKIRQWKNENKAFKIFGLLAERIGKDMDSCFDEFGDQIVEEFNGLYEAFEACSVDPKVLEERGFKGDWIKHFCDIAKDNIAPPFVMLKGRLELTCSSSEGIQRIREALKAGEEFDGVQTRYIAAPKYEFTVKAPDYKVGEEIVKESTQKIITTIEKAGGTGKFYRMD